MNKNTIINKLMVVAHPDDESLFGGQELLKEQGWLVVCLTNGSHATRKAQFFRVMEKTNATGVMWDYPDQPGLSSHPQRAKAAWRPCWQEIKKALAQLSRHYDFKKIVTHGPDGEYGHEHHKMTYYLVKATFPDKNIYCFSQGVCLNTTMLTEKMALLDIYSQQLTEQEKQKYIDWINRGAITPDIIFKKSTA